MGLVSYYGFFTLFLVLVSVPAISLVAVSLEQLISSGAYARLHLMTPRERNEALLLPTSAYIFACACLTGAFVFFGKVLSGMQVKYFHQVAEGIRYENKMRAAAEKKKITNPD